MTTRPPVRGRCLPSVGDVTNTMSASEHCPATMEIDLLTRQTCVSVSHEASRGESSLGAARPTGIHVLALILLACTRTHPVDRPGESFDARLAVLVPDTAGVRSLRFDASCSRRQPRIAVGEVSWRIVGRDYSNQRLDVTVYKNGFETGLFTVLSPIKKGRGFSRRLVGTAPPPWLFDEGLGLKVSQVRFDSGSNRISVSVEPLKTSLNHFWRVLTRTRRGWVSSPTVRGQAPVCPVDEER